MLERKRCQPPGGLRVKGGDYICEVFITKRSLVEENLCFLHKSVEKDVFWSLFVEIFWITLSVVVNNSTAHPRVLIVPTMCCTTSILWKIPNTILNWIQQGTLQFFGDSFQLNKNISTPHLSNFFVVAWPHWPERVVFLKPAHILLFTIYLVINPSTHWYLQFNQFDLGIKIVFRWFLKFCSSLSWSA